MPARKSEAHWNGDLLNGNGTMTVGDGVFEGPFTHASRFKEGDGTNPEELLGAAHAGCFSMFLSALLSGDDFVPNHVHTTATVHIGTVDDAPTIHTIELDCTADRSCEPPVPKIRHDGFRRPVTLSLGVHGTIWVGDAGAESIFAFDSDGNLLHVLDSMEGFTEDFTPGLE